MTTACDIVNRVDEILASPADWIKGEYYRMDAERHVSYCLIGAIRQAVSGDTLAPCVFCEEGVVYRQVIRTIREILNTPGLHHISVWNDDPNRTFDEVKDLLRQTREALCA